MQYGDKINKSIAEAAMEVMSAPKVTAPDVSLVLSMKKVLGSMFMFYFKAHSFHWNVEGASFPQYHSFFDTIYNQLHDSIDPIAEHIRILGEYAPSSVSELALYSAITENRTSTMPPAVMFQSLLADNNTIINVLTMAYNQAELAKEVGLSNFLQDKIDSHKKLGWMITSTSKGTGV